MGTRALITKNGKPFIATHWDGNPQSLGKELLGKISDSQIISVAKEHTIDASDSSVRAKINKERFEHIAKKTKGKYSAKDIEKLDKEGKELTFGMMGAVDYAVGDIKNYGDFAEYQYDLSGGIWRFRPLGGQFPQSVQHGEALKPLTEESVKE